MKKVRALHGEDQVEIDRVTGAELRLLLVLCTQDITDAVEQLKICLTRVRRQRCDEGKGHGSCHAKLGFTRISRGLVILASTEHDTVRGTRFCLDDTLAIGPTNFLANASKTVHHSTKISLEVGQSGAHNTASNALQDILILELSRGTIGEWQIQGRSRMTAVHNRSKTTSCREGLDHDIVHDIVNNNTCSCVVDRVDGIVVSIVLVAVEISCLTTVSTEMQEE